MYVPVAAMAFLNCCAIHGFAPPDDADVACVVPDDRLGGPDTPAASEPHFVRLPEHGLDGLLLAHAQSGDGGPLSAVDVAQREEVEEVADGGGRGS